MMRANYSHYAKAKQKSASERGKRMAARRWAIDRELRDWLAAMEPIKFSGRIVRRIVVIDNETTVREVAIYDFDSIREAHRKTRKVLLFTP